MTQPAKIFQFPSQSAGQSFEDYWSECEEYGHRNKAEALRLFSASPHQYFYRAGWVYVLGHERMPGIYKIGRTTGKIESRMRQLSTTGVPGQFDCAHAAWFADCKDAESFVHDALWRYRVTPDREFFAVSLEQARNALLQYSSCVEIHPDHMIEQAHNRFHSAISTEAVNGVRVVTDRNSNLLDIEVPF